MIEDSVILKVGVGIEELRNLKKFTGVKSNQELAELAGNLFKWAVKETQEGRNIVSVHIDHPVPRYRKFKVPVVEVEDAEKDQEKTI